MSNETVMVTGGAGYIGSHVALQLTDAGERVVILDDLSTGFADAVLGAKLIVGNTGDRQLVKEIINDHQVKAVMHFAAHTIVPESVSDPGKYYSNNTCSTLALLRCCRDAGVEHFIFSSTAAVYGTPQTGVCSEDSPTRPINPYGSSKLMSEQMIRDFSAASAMRHVILRYFNVAGSDPEGRIGQSTRNATLLVKVACEAALGKRPHIKIFGTDYETPDGTGVRDYIHVDDLARAHIDALQYLRAGGDCETLNCGYGHGYSVREVLDTVRRVSNSAFEIREEPRRPGDPGMLIADALRAGQVLGWTPRRDNLEEIVRHSLDWERKLR